MSNNWFYKIYGVFGGILLLLCAAVVAACYLNFHVKLVVPGLLALIILVAVLFTFTIKKGILAVFQICNEFLDDAIAGKPLQPLREETELASVEEKIARFANMREKGFQDSQKEKERVETFLSDLSHQTKTPITNILLYSQLLEERSRGHEQIHQNVLKLTAQSEKLKGLIEELVDMSRLENGIISCTGQRENMRDFLLQIVGDYYDKAQKKHIILRLTCDDGIEGFFDSKWMREAMGNVVDNGIKYSPENSDIQITVTAYQIFVRVDITDEGIGISEEEANKIFQRFYRSRRVSKTEGLGLGLYIAREMITAQNGYMRISSEEGRGSTFSIFIPKESMQ